jgi:hypothetical protein
MLVGISASPRLFLIGRKDADLTPRQPCQWGHHGCGYEAGMREKWLGVGPVSAVRLVKRNGA